MPKASSIPFCPPKALPTAISSRVNAVRRNAVLNVFPIRIARFIRWAIPRREAGGAGRGLEVLEIEEKVGLQGCRLLPCLAPERSFQSLVQRSPGLFVFRLRNAALFMFHFQLEQLFLERFEKQPGAARSRRRGGGGRGRVGKLCDGDAQIRLGGQL